MPLIVEVPVRFGMRESTVELLEMLSVPMLVKLVVTVWLAKLAMIWAVPFSTNAVLPLVAPPIPVVKPLKVAEPVVGTDVAGVKLPKANAPDWLGMPLPADAQSPYADEVSPCPAATWLSV